MVFALYFAEVCSWLENFLVKNIDASRLYN